MSPKGQPRLFDQGIDKASARTRRKPEIDLKRIEADLKADAGSGLKVSVVRGKMTSPNESKICPHCGGRLFYDQEDKEWRCINCAHPPDSNNHNGVVELIPPVTDEIAKAAKSKRSELPHKIESPQGCRQCKNQRKTWLICKGKEFYEPREIRFCPHQIIWTLSNAELLHSGEWPAEPTISSYTAMPLIKKKKGGKSAPFTKPVEIIAEVERRLEHCRLDGLMVLLYHTLNFEALELAKYYRCSESEALHRIEAVIWKVSGWNFRPEFPYRRWLAYRDFENWKS